VPLQIDSLETVTEEQWAEIWHRLRLYTWRRYGPLKVKLGLDLDDVVQQAITDTILHTRIWPKEKIDLFFFLCGVVKSIISHRWESEQKKVSIDDPELMSLDSIVTGSFAKYLNSESTYNKIVYQELINRIYELVKGDEELVEIVKLWGEDPGLKPKDIAQKLNMDMTDIRNAQKRLRRKLKELKELNNV
jgi:DNA-directed RNA polymerase specialized sigma24 family protein